MYKLKKKIHHPAFLDDIKLFARNVKDLETDANNKNIQSGYRNGI